jgi:tRNA pseudouridine38-40 synthase
VVSLAYDGSVEVERLGAALNQQLPGDVVVLGAEESAPSFDARADATSRAYEYRVLNRRERAPLRARRVLHHPRPLDLDALKAVAAAMVGQHDFTAFTPSQTEHRFFHRTVLASEWITRDGELVYRVEANAFLRHMVRIAVGTMLAVGRGDWTVDRFVALLEGAPRSDAFVTALPHGLCLTGVTYSRAM